MEGEADSRWGIHPERTMLALVALIASLVLAAVAPPARDCDPPPDVPSLVVEPTATPIAVLVCLPDIGPSRAEAIAAIGRDRPFESPEDLERRVPGIGPATLGSLRPYLRFASLDPSP